MPVDPDAIAQAAVDILDELLRNGLDESMCPRSSVRAFTQVIAARLGAQIEALEARVATLENA